MDRLSTAAALLAASLPVSVLAETAEQPEPLSPSQYFVGIKGGISKIGNSDRIVQSNGERVEASESDFEGFAGVDIGIYTPGGQSRLYYSYERHNTDVSFPNTPNYELVASMHLLSADYLFRKNRDFTPFVGLHFGYSFVEPDSNSFANFDVSGFVFGLQGGVNWTVVDQLSFELGFRHSLLPSDTQSWIGQDNNGNSVTIESQQKGVSSLYGSVSYRF
ncbi:outer membrane beta-barrel protein [Photobacterium sp. J15]|uniref:outer membrane beta-barrel protein n=1 Tax=Photobacterium sp. J15 TaxID=265901 RepID=UPI0007E48F42|nr:outer membrane beta-barrel protein [Photobacterium sp. J15]